MRSNIQIRNVVLSKCVSLGSPGGAYMEVANMATESMQKNNPATVLQLHFNYSGYAVAVGHLGEMGTCMSIVVHGRGAQEKQKKT